MNKLDYCEEQPSVAASHTSMGGICCYIFYTAAMLYESPEPPQEKRLPPPPFPILQKTSKNSEQPKKKKKEKTTVTTYGLCYRAMSAELMKSASIVRPSVRVAIISELNARISFKF